MQADESRRSPFENCYWAEPGKLLAGEYPGSLDEISALKKIRALQSAGVNCLIDLTEDGELRPYLPLWAREAENDCRDFSHTRMSIRDLDVPHSAAHMRAILDLIDSGIAEGKTVYVHCWGGVGRTGTVIGCRYISHGDTGEQALQRLAKLWQGMQKIGRRPESPETREQKRYVMNWREGGNL